MADEIKFTLELGTFEKNEFKWKTLKSFNDIKKAKKAFKDFCLEQFYYTEEELFKVWHSVRVDVELKHGKKLLNWCGIYFREKQSKRETEDAAIIDENALSIFTHQRELLNESMPPVGPRIEKD